MPEDKRPISKRGSNSYEAEERHRQIGQKPSRKLPLAGWTLVVADDEPDQVAFLSTVFEDHGATVFQAANGDETLALARREKPDLLTLDLAMPGRPVDEVYEILRKDPELSDLKICVITGRPELRKLIYTRSVRPPEGYLNKPVTEEALVRVVRRILELSHRSR